MNPVTRKLRQKPFVYEKLGHMVSGMAKLVVPDTCLICGVLVNKQGGCCSSCWGKLRFVQPPFCPVMGTPFSIDMGKGFLSAEAIASPPLFKRLRSVVLYDDLARKLVSNLKYSDRTDLAPWLGDWMVVAGKELVEQAELIIPIPLHYSRLRQRRYNQAAELARRISRKTQVNYLPDGLIRRKPTRQQVGLSESEREQNLSGAFVVPVPIVPEIKGRHVLLVDDVYTTGATVKAATRTLLRAGAATVDVLVFAKVETGMLDDIYG